MRIAIFNPIYLFNKYIFRLIVLQIFWLPLRINTFRAQLLSACKLTAGRKAAKSSITVLAFVNPEGRRRLPLFLFERAARPRCFNRQNPVEGGFQYAFDDGMWNNCEIFLSGFVFSIPMSLEIYAETFYYLWKMHLFTKTRRYNLLYLICVWCFCLRIPPPYSNR